MSSTQSALRLSLLATVLGVVMWFTPHGALADTTGSSVTLKPCELEGDTIFAVGNGGGSCTIYAHSTVPLRIDVPSGAFVRWIKRPGFDVSHDDKAHHIDVAVLDDNPPGDRTSIYIDLRSEYSVTVRVIVASDASPVQNWIVKHRTKTEAHALLQARAARAQSAASSQQVTRAQAEATAAKAEAATATAQARRAHQRVATVRKKSVKDKQRALAKQKASHEQALADKDKQHRHELVAKDQQIAAKDHKIGELTKQLTDTQTQLDLEIDKLVEKRIVRDLVAGHETVELNQARPRTRGIALSGLEWVRHGDRQFLRFMVQNNRDASTELSTLKLQDEFGDDHAGTVQIGDKAAANKKFIAVLEPGETVVGTVAVHDFAQLGANAKLVVSGPDTQPAFRIIPIDPPAEPPLTPRQQRARQVMIGAHGMAGAFWLADGLDADELKATSFKGVGIRLVKGIVDMIAVEVEIAGGTTGTARFENMTIDDMQGELTRSASFGRAGFGGMLRFGDRVNPYLRLGLGVQGASFDAAFSEGEDPESEFNVGFLVNAGAGIDVRLGDHFVAGATVAYAQETGGSGQAQRALNAGIQLSYSWNP